MKEYGFVINQCDPCVEKKKTNEGQITMVWHVKDMKVPHKNKEEVAKFIN